jgi:hypothetical protein
MTAVPTIEPTSTTDVGRGWMGRPDIGLPDGYVVVSLQRYDTGIQIFASAHSLYSQIEGFGLQHPAFDLCLEDPDGNPVPEMVLERHFSDVDMDEDDSMVAICLNGSAPALVKFCTVEFDYAEEFWDDAPVAVDGKLSLADVTIKAVRSDGSYPGFVFVDVTSPADVALCYGENCGGPDWFDDMADAQARTAAILADWKVAWERLGEVTEETTA